MKRPPFTFNGVEIEAGTRATVDLPAAQLYTHTQLDIPIEVIHAEQEGPRLMICAAIHGDELNGVEIVRRVLKLPMLKRLRGTLIACPIVNVFGFIHKSRYLPDRRDLNRSFPGSEHGSLASRMAHLFTTEVLEKCTHAIDLHTGAIHRANLPQVRASLDEPQVEGMARAFGVPVILNASLRNGSLRGIADELDIPVITYEAGEALRFDEACVAAGVKGVVNVMRHLGMLPKVKPRKKPPPEPVVARSTAWVRASTDGIYRPAVPLGARVRKGDLLAVVSDPFGTREDFVTSSVNGLVIGRTNLPLVNQGEAIYHLARFEEVGEVAKQVEEFTSGLLDEDVYGADEPRIA
jgi:predicted deacylase